MRTRPGTEIDDPVCSGDDVEVVLDDQHARALRDQRGKGRRHVADVLGVQARARLIEDEERSFCGLRKSTRKLESLRFAPGEGRQRLSERKVAEPHLRDRRERVHDRRLVRTAVHAPTTEPIDDLIDGEPEDLGDIESSMFHCEDLGTEALSLADGTQERNVG